MALGFQIELGFGNVGFCGEGKTEVPGEKPLGARMRTNNKLNPHMAPSPGIEPGPHWWEACVGGKCSTNGAISAPHNVYRLTSANAMASKRSKRGKIQFRIAVLGSKTPFPPFFMHLVRYARVACDMYFLRVLLVHH